MTGAANGTGRDPLATWTAFADRSRWPDAPGRVFVPEALEVLSDALYASSDVDLGPRRSAVERFGSGEWERGVLHEVGGFLRRMLVDGSLTAYARPVGGGGTRPVRSHAFDAEAALDAVATGRMGLPDHTGAIVDHWVFLDEVEFRLLLMIHSPAGGSPDDMLENLRRRHDRLCEIVLSNLPAIAGADRAATGIPALATGPREGDPTPAELDAMFHDARRVLEARHQIALEERMERWLLWRFGEDRHRELFKPDFKEASRIAFAPYWSNDLFDAAWGRAVVNAPLRANPGRPTKAESQRNREGTRQLGEMEK